MRMFRTSVYMQFFNDLAAQTIVGNHSANGQFNHSDRILGKHIACFSIFIAAQITGVTEVNFLDQFLARQTDLVSIFVSSGSAKWAIFAPIFVPMFMLLGYHPGFTQLLYRLGDSPTNCFTPMNPYLWMILSVAQEKYMPKAAIGTLVSNLIPIAVCLQIAWIIFLIIWMTLGLPIGPGVTMQLPSGIL